MLTTCNKVDITIIAHWSGIWNTLTDMQGMAEKSWKAEHCLTSVNQTFISEEYESSFGFHLLVMVVSGLVHLVIMEVTRDISLSLEI